MKTESGINPSSWLQSPISMVSSATDTKTYPTTVGEVLDGIRSGKWAKPVERVREKYAKAFKAAEEEGNPAPAVAAKKAVHRLKTSLPAVAFSGAFSERKDDALQSHSGFLCVDCDNCQEPAQMREKLALDPHVQAVFISPTSTGVKALVRIIAADTATHLQSFTAARKHFKDSYDIVIDEACKNVSRLCYVAHDPDIFVREEDAQLFEPLEEEKPRVPKRAEQEEDIIPAGMMKLPEPGLVTNSESAESIFNKILEQEPPVMYLRAGRVVTLEEKNQLDGKSEVVIEDMSPPAFRSAVEKCGTLFAYCAPRGQLLIKPKALMSADIASVLLASEERKRLSPISVIHRCPILVENYGKSLLLGRGYHREFGGRYITCGSEIDIKIPLNQAAAILLELFEEFDFVTEADKARAVTSLIMPALRFGSLLRCHFAALLVEADHSQAGKGTLVEIIQRVYNERAGMTPKRQGGVGSFDEDLSAKMLEGRVFIQPDNIRNALNSEFCESCLTCPPDTTILARVPYKAGVEVDPNKHIFHLTSNKFEATQDLANRSCVVRIKKRVGYKWKRFPDGRRLLAHVEANPWRYLSAVYSIVAQWVARGKPSNEDELRGEGKFREYWQVSDWFAQKIFLLPSPLESLNRRSRCI